MNGVDLHTMAPNLFIEKYHLVMICLGLGLRGLEVRKGEGQLPYTVGNGLENEDGNIPSGTQRIAVKHSPPRKPSEPSL